MLRVYEFDRYNGTVWQVDMMIGNGSLLVHPRITNPTDCDLRGYWWTCVAVTATEKTRIFAPATHVAQTSREDTQRPGVSMRDSPWPSYAMAIENGSFRGYDGAFPTDNSFIANHQIGDMFLRIPDTVYSPYIAHTEEDGFVLVHGTPEPRTNPNPTRKITLANVLRPSVEWDQVLHLGSVRARPFHAGLPRWGWQAHGRLH
jgi:hypothetical protein